MLFISLGPACVSEEGRADEDSPCQGEQRPCSCRALEDGWCVQYADPEADTQPGSLPTDECEELGGREVLEACPAEDRAGICEQNDDCYQPDFVFYRNYAGTFQGYSTLEQVEQACIDSQIAEGECEGWLPAN